MIKAQALSVLAQVGPTLDVKAPQDSGASTTSVA